jgi:hypothetical protein
LARGAPTPAASPDLKSPDLKKTVRKAEYGCPAIEALIAGLALFHATLS